MLIKGKGEEIYEGEDEEESKEEEVVPQKKKMGQWKYSPHYMATQILSTLLEKVRIRWENAKKIVKDIYA